MVLTSAAFAVTNSTTQEFEANLSPAKKSSKKKPQAAQLDISLITSSQDDLGNVIKPIQATLAEFSFPKGMKLNTGLIKKTCKASALKKSKSASSCHKDTKIGTGAVYLNAEPILTDEAKGEVTLFSGGKDKVVLLITVKNPLPATVVLEGSLKQASGDFGQKLSVKVPTVEALGTTIVIPRIELKVKKTIKYKKKGSKKAKAGVIETPTTCNGTWKFSETTSFVGDVSFTKEDEIACK